MTDGPEIAVVVGAFTRRTFLSRAVDSVLAQTLPRDRFEVVVVKDFADPELDRSFAAAGVATILDAEPRIGRWLLRGVRATRAPFVAFLDDDDEFEPERLAHVLDEFRLHPEVGYYRNRVRVIDRAGRAIPPERWRRIETDAPMDRSGPILVPPDGKTGIVPLLTQELHSSFNSSTMVVRRALLEDEAGRVFESIQLPDLALFIAAILSPFGLYLDDRRLTRFRYYDSNVTGRVAWLRHAAESHATLGVWARRGGRTDFADWLERSSRHFERLFRSATLVAEVGAGAPRRVVATRGAEYLRFLGRDPVERRSPPSPWPSTMIGLAGVLSPALGHRVARARSAVRGG